MCDPGTLATFATSGGIAAYGQDKKNKEAQRNEQRARINARQVADARNRELDESRARQKVLADQNQGLFGKALGAFTPDAQASAHAAAEQRAKANFGASVTSVEDGAHRTMEGAPAIVQNTFDRAAQGAHDRGAASADRYASLDAYKTTADGNGTALQGAGREMDVNNGFSRSEAALLPHYQDFAQAQWELPDAGRLPSSGIGDALMGIGKLGASLAGGGGAADLNKRLAGWMK